MVVLIWWGRKSAKERVSKLHNSRNVQMVVFFVERVGKENKSWIPSASTPLDSHLPLPLLLRVTTFPTWIRWELLPAFSKFKDLEWMSIRMRRGVVFHASSIYEMALCFHKKKKIADTALAIYTSPGTDSYFLILTNFWFKMRVMYCPPLVLVVSR